MSGTQKHERGHEFYCGDEARAEAEAFAEAMQSIEQDAYNDANEIPVAIMQQDGKDEAMHAGCESSLAVSVGGDTVGMGGLNMPIPFVAVSPQDGPQDSAGAQDTMPCADMDLTSVELPSGLHPSPTIHPQQQQQQQPIDPTLCRICSKGSEDGKQMLRFLPSERDREDVTLHVFCGRTVGILPNRQHVAKFEILTKAGIKNKHGIGSDVHSALNVSRSAIPSTQEALNEEDYSQPRAFYLLKEFEAHLELIRNESRAQAGIKESAASSADIDLMVNVGSAISRVDGGDPPDKAVPKRAGAGRIHKMGRCARVSALPIASQPHLNPDGNKPSHQVSTMEGDAGDWMFDEDALMREANTKMTQGNLAIEPNTHQPYFYGATLNAEGRVQCGCGGSYSVPGTPKGSVSWRNHQRTKRHKKWMETNSDI